MEAVIRLSEISHHLPRSSSQVLFLVANAKEKVTEPRGKHDQHEIFPVHLDCTRASLQLHRHSRGKSRERQTNFAAKLAIRKRVPRKRVPRKSLTRKSLIRKSFGLSFHIPRTYFSARGSKGTGMGTIASKATQTMHAAKQRPAYLPPAPIATNPFTRQTSAPTGPSDGASGELPETLGETGKESGWQLCSRAEWLT